MHAWLLAFSLLGWGGTAVNVLLLLNFQTLFQTWSSLISTFLIFLCPFVFIWFFLLILSNYFVEFIFWIESRGGELIAASALYKAYMDNKCVHVHIRKAIYSVRFSYWSIWRDKESWILFLQCSKKCEWTKTSFINLHIL